MPASVSCKLRVDEGEIALIALLDVGVVNPHRRLSLSQEAQSSHGKY